MLLVKRKGVFGGGGPWLPLEKLISLAGQKRSLAGQIWELGRTEMGSLAEDN